MQNKNIILWEGNSPIDGKPVVVIITGVKFSSSNRKTGTLLQVWIIRSDIHPLDAIHTGGDLSICGNCIHRGAKGDGSDRSCYVTPMAPGQIYRCYKEGKYQHWSEVNKEKFKAMCLLSEGIRWGAYGDPSIVPFEVFSDAAQYSKTNLGYTHQWRSEFASPYKGHLQASCDRPAEAKEAQSLGWKTFTTTVDNAEIEGEHHCKGGVSITCQSCRLCDGNKANVFISVHGSNKGVKSFTANIAPSIV